MAERDYKVVYKSRTRPVPYDGDDDYQGDYYRSDRRSQRYYDDDYRGPSDYRGGGDGGGGRYYVDERNLPITREIVVDRDPRDRYRDRERDLALVSRPRETTRSEYDFLSDRDEIFTRSSASGGNVIVLDSRDLGGRDGERGGGGSLTEWEIVRPERGDDGVLVIDAGDLRGRGGGRKGAPVREIEVVTAGSQGRARSVAGRGRSLVDAMREVRVTEEVDDDRRSVYSRGGDRRSRALVVVPAEAPIAPRRMPSAFRHDHSPSSDTRRRSRSIGFHKSQISHHDVSESRHERPGAEAVIAGRYLIDHRGERVDMDEGDYDVGSRRRSRHHRRHRDDDDGSEDYEYERRERSDRYYETDINGAVQERTRPYSPQRGPSPRRRRHHRRHHRRREEKDVSDSQDEDDKRSYYSELYTKTKKVYD